MNIRRAALSDRDEIADIYRQAFDESEQELIARLAADLLVEQTRPPIISLLAESDSRVVGHIAFTPVAIDRRDDLRAYILAPLAVRPRDQKRGAGALLVQSGVNMLRDAGTHLIFVYGDPAYYGRFGFGAAVAKKFRPPYELQYPFGWQAVTLNRFTPENAYGSIACISALDDPRLW